MASYESFEIKEHPSRFLLDSPMPKFWPPKPNRFLRVMLEPLLYLFGKYFCLIDTFDLGNLKEVFRDFKPGDGILITPNHSHQGDAYVLLEASKKLRRYFYFMAAWPAFTLFGGLSGWLLQTMGAFSVDRDGSDRKALRCATEILVNGNTLVIFPEGEIHRLNERLKPLLDGVAFIAINAQKQLIKQKEEGRIWVLPAALGYEFTESVTNKIEKALTRLERHFAWYRPDTSSGLRTRIIRLGELILTIKEKEKLGSSMESKGDLKARLEYLIDAVLTKHENAYLNKGAPQSPVSIRVKALRRKLIEIWKDESRPEDERDKAKGALDDVQLALQLSSYPGDYIAEEPSVERMAETVEKYQEDIFGVIRSIGKRKAVLKLGKPIDIKGYLANQEQYDAVSVLTHRLEGDIQELMLSKGKD